MRTWIWWSREPLPCETLWVDARGTAFQLLSDCWSTFLWVAETGFLLGPTSSCRDLTEWYRRFLQGQRLAYLLFSLCLSCKTPWPPSTVLLRGHSFLSVSESPLVPFEDSLRFPIWFQPNLTISFGHTGSSCLGGWGSSPSWEMTVAYFLLQAARAIHPFTPLDLDKTGTSSPTFCRLVFLLHCAQRYYKWKVGWGWAGILFWWNFPWDFVITVERGISNQITWGRILPPPLTRSFMTGIVTQLLWEALSLSVKG